MRAKFHAVGLVLIAAGFLLCPLAVTAEEKTLNLDQLNEKLTKNPDDWDSLFDRSIVLAVLHRYPAALADMDHAIHLRPKDYKGYANKAAICGRAKQFAEAKESYTQAIELRPDDAGLLSERAKAFACMGSRQKEIDDLTAALRAMKSSMFAQTRKLNHITSDAVFEGSLLTRRGNAYYQLTKYDDAYRDFDAAIKLNPNDGGAYLGRGLLHSQKDQYQASLDDFNRAVRANP
ncbi:MAG: tetratricopeptide repeat protein, partial [Terriglobales bacterium]